METRASYVAIGAFVLALSAGLAAFVIWLGGVTFDRSGDRYLVYFSGSVTGLQAGSPVRYQGVPVGTVRDIRLDPARVGQVIVTIEVNEGTPILADSVASLEVLGIAGGHYILIASGQPDSPLLTEVTTQRPPVIASRPSALQSLYEAAPEIVETVNELMGNLADVLSQENRDSLAQTLTNIQRITDVVAREAEAMAGTVERLESLAVNTDGLVAELRVDAARISDRLDETLGSVERSFRVASGDVSQTARELTAGASEFRGLFAAIRPGITDFAGGGLYELSELMSELRLLAAAMARVVQDLENDPGAFLFGDRDREGGVRLPQ